MDTLVDNSTLCQYPSPNCFILRRATWRFRLSTPNHSLIIAFDAIDFKDDITFLRKDVSFFSIPLGSNKLLRKVSWNLNTMLKR